MQRPRTSADAPGVEHAPAPATTRRPARATGGSGESAFRALVLERLLGGLAASVRHLDAADLPPGDVRVAVEYSAVNYKDALILAERGYRAAAYPMVPGIDLAGTVVASAAPAFAPGDRVALNGGGLGERRWGGYAELASVEAASLVHVPDRFTTRDAAAIGTAGLAAALAVGALEAYGLAPGAGPVLVTGAGGSVGRLATALLAARGHAVTASTGRPAQHAALRDMGAAAVVGRLAPPDAPLSPERWAAAVDTVGGATLAAVLAAVRYGAPVAAAGFTAGLDVPLHLAPLLVRGAAVLGVNTSACPADQRRTAWALLAASLPDRALTAGVAEVALEDVPAVAAQLLAGGTEGRTIVAVHGRAGG